MHLWFNNSNSQPLEHVYFLFPTSLVPTFYKESMNKVHGYIIIMIIEVFMTQEIIITRSQSHIY